MKKKYLLTIGLTAIILTSCGNKTNENNSANEVLLKRIGELEEENKKLKSQLDMSNEDNSESEPTIESKYNTNLIGGEEKGQGDVILRTPGGEGKDVILIVDKNTSMTSIDLDAENVDVDGNEPTCVYIDGKENMTLQLSKGVYSQNMLILEKDLLNEGKHIVEVIQEINGEQTFYRQLFYTVKN